MGAGWSALVRSRKFWVMVLDAVVTLALYLSAKYLGASAQQDVLEVIKVLQPIAGLVIVMIAAEDVAMMKWGRKG